MSALDKLTIKGFKSIKHLEDLKLGNLNIIIGGNGAGKSNFIAFFRLLHNMFIGGLDNHIKNNGGISDLLFNGRKTTPAMFFEAHFGPRGYRFSIVPNPDDSGRLLNEARYYEHSRSGWWELDEIGQNESALVQEARSGQGSFSYSLPVYQAIHSWRLYHVHDTSKTARMRGYEIVQDNAYLRIDGANIASFLLKLKTESPSEYREIILAIRSVMPFFDDFVLQPTNFGVQVKINLSWNQKGSDYPMQPYHFSDGTIRFICLATALLQPNPPSTIIIDEPELGLHPAAIAVLAELIQDASTRTQVIIATQSPALIDHFGVEDIIVVNREDGASTFKRLKEDDFSEWLESYSVGELWTKNVIVGGPVDE